MLCCEWCKESYNFPAYSILVLMYCSFRVLSWKKQGTVHDIVLIKMLCNRGNSLAIHFHVYSYTLNIYEEWSLYVVIWAFDCFELFGNSLTYYMNDLLCAYPIRHNKKCSLLFLCFNYFRLYACTPLPWQGGGSLELSLIIWPKWKYTTKCRIVFSVFFLKTWRKVDFYNCLCMEAPPKRRYIFRLYKYIKGQGFQELEYTKSVGKLSFG